MSQMFRGNPANLRLFQYNVKHLSNFVVGNSNQYAYKAVQLFANTHCPEYYNPLLIIGAAGSGKTHLLEGIYQKFCWKLKSAASTIHYVTGLNFSREYVAEIRTNGLDAFRARYLTYKIVLMDDVHLLKRKKKTQHEFAYLFDMMNEKGGKFILTSNSPIEPNVDWDYRLVSRLKNGLNIKINPPDYQTKMNILQTMQLKFRRKIDQSFLDIIAQKSDTNLHDLMEIAEKILSGNTTSRNSIEKTISDIMGHAPEHT
jgi:chromosomal replication initiator protein